MLKVAAKKHHNLSKYFVRCIKNFTSGGEQMKWAYLTALQQAYMPDTETYFVILNNCLDELSKSFDDETDGKLLELLIEKAL